MDEWLLSCEIAEEFQELFSFVVPQGKFFFTRIPQGTTPASDLFNLCTDPEIRNVVGILKNIDDILASGKNLDEIKPLIRKILNIFRKRGMKIKKSKFGISQKVKFGGCQVQAVQQRGNITISPEEDKIEELLGAQRPKT